MTDSLFTIGTESAESTEPDTNAGTLVWQQNNGESSIHAASIADVLPTARRNDPGDDGVTSVYFNETGHSLGWGFKAFWERSGGLPVFGYPLTEEFTQRNADTGEFYTTQYVERQRFEWHPEHAGTPYEVLLGRLGVEVLAEQGRNWRDFPSADPSSAHYIPETGHAVAAEFYDYWTSHGLEFSDAGTSYRESVALFGYPISEPMTETNMDGDTVLTQWFERARFEYHPDNPPEYQVLLGRLGAEYPGSE